MFCLCAYQEGGKKSSKAENLNRLGSEKQKLTNSYKSSYKKK